MNRFDALRPSGWNETIEETLKAVETEGVHHDTEALVMQRMDDSHDYEIEDGAVEFAVARLRARAVVLAAAVDLRTPTEWEKLLRYDIIDPDGWREPNGRPFTDPITLREFEERFARCTVSLTR